MSKNLEQDAREIHETIEKVINKLVSDNSLNDSHDLIAGLCDQVAWFLSDSGYHFDEEDDDELECFVVPMIT